MNESIQPTSVIQRKMDLLSCQVDDETVLLDTDVGSYFGMNPVASHIWELIATPHTAAEICKKLLAEYAIDADSCTKQVMAFLAELSNLKIIQVSN